MYRSDAVLQSCDVQQPLLQINLLPRQADQFGDTQTVAVSDQDQSGVACAMTTDERCCHHHRRDLCF
jgi:hypothetical protein